MELFIFAIIFTTKSINQENSNYSNLFLSNLQFKSTLNIKNKYSKEDDNIINGTTSDITFIIQKDTRTLTFTGNGRTGD